MSWLPVVARVLGAPLRWLGSLAASLARWLVEEPVRAAILALMLNALAHWLIIDPGLRAERDAQQARAVAGEALAGEWKAAHDRLATGMARARLLAGEADRRNAARVAAEMDAIRERTAHDYQDRLGDSRAALDRLQRELAAAGAAGAAADPGGGAAAAVPAALAARCRAFGAADCDALLAALPGLLSAAEDNTAKLIGLQDWARAIVAVDFSAPGALPDGGGTGVPAAPAEPGE